MEYIVHAKFRLQDQKEVLALLPQEQVHIKALSGQGIVEALYVSTDLSQVWLVMQADSQDHIQKILEELPLYTYMQVEITPLSKM